MEYDFVIYPKSYNGTYINGYVKKSTYYELHITDYSNHHTVLFDVEDLEKVKEHFWSCCKTGKGKNSIIVYTSCKNIEGCKKQYLKNILYGKKIEKCEKLITENRNQLDFRKENLLVDRRRGVSRRRTSLHGGYGENGIYPRKSGEKTIGYRFFDNQKKCHYFGIKRHGTLEKCYEECKKQRELLVSKN